jgi:hypothetical protein
MDRERDAQLHQLLRTQICSTLSSTTILGDGEPNREVTSSAFIHKK